MGSDNFYILKIRDKIGFRLTLWACGLATCLKKIAKVFLYFISNMKNFLFLT